MTSGEIQVHGEAVPSGGRRDWWRAIKAIVRLARNTEDTTQVFEIIHSLAGDNVERVYRRAASSPEGLALLRDKPLLNPILSDRQRLAAMPDGSLGREYLQFMIDGEITADGLVAAQDVARAHDEPVAVVDPDREYLAERLVEQHDLWHVLTGYGRDDTGELANLWFSYGQFGQLGMGFIAFMGTLDGPKGLRWWRFMRKAYRRGREARNLLVCPLGQMLELPIDEAREQLGVGKPLQWHPRGVLTGNRRHEGIGCGEPNLAF